MENNNMGINNNDIIETKENKELFTKLEVEHTPFTAVGKNIGEESETWFLSWGKYKIGRDTKTYEECCQLLENEPWKIIVGVVIAITDAKPTAQ